MRVNINPGDGPHPIQWDDGTTGNFVVASGPNPYLTDAGYTLMFGASEMRFRRAGGSHYVQFYTDENEANGAIRVERLYSGVTTLGTRTGQ